MNSSNSTHFSLLPKICSHLSSKQCQFSFSGVMSVPVSSTSHFHPSATSSPADGRWHSWVFFTTTSQLNSFDSFEACCVTNNLALPPIKVIDLLHRLQWEHPLYQCQQLPRIQEPLAHCLYATIDCLAHYLCPQF
jgi:hypothetical protein